MLLLQRKIDKEDKSELVSNVSEGRTTSSKELTRIEMAKAIKHLEGEVTESRKKRMAKALSIARSLFMVVGTGKEVNFDGLNAFGKKMFGKEKFYELSNDEISKIIIGLEKIQKSKQDGSTLPTKKV